MKNNAFSIAAVAILVAAMNFNSAAWARSRNVDNRIVPARGPISQNLVIPAGGGYAHIPNCPSLAKRRVQLYYVEDAKLRGITPTGVCPQCKAIVNYSAPQNYRNNQGQYANQRQYSNQRPYQNQYQNQYQYQNQRPALTPRQQQELPLEMTLTPEQRIELRRLEAQKQMEENNRRYRMEKQLEEIEENRQWNNRMAEWDNKQPVYNQRTVYTGTTVDGYGRTANGKRVVYTTDHYYHDDGGRAVDAAKTNAAIRANNEAAKAQSDAVLRMYGK